ncbi:unnamed protein product [Sympodiomycopsis kandeliae]
MLVSSASVALLTLAGSARALLPGLLDGSGQTGNLTSGKLPILPAPLNGLNPVLPDYLGAVLGNNTYDYIVVGAGTAGMVLASRLSEDPKVTVAVIEAGDDYAATGIPLLTQDLVQVPGADVVGCGASAADQLFQAPVDWGFQTAPQSGANGRVLKNTRGKTLGGSSARNFMILQAPSAKSLDQWVQLTGDQQWSFANRRNDYKKSFAFTPPKHDIRREDPAAQYDSNDWIANNPDALLSASYPNYAQPFSKYMQLSVNEKGIKTIPSFNGGQLLGAQYCATTINPNGGVRSSSRDAWVKASKRKNIKLFTGSLVKRVILNTTASATPKATGVFFSSSNVLTNRFELFRLNARKEVILSAGAYQSPQLLMTSGIGPKDQLQAANVPVVVENSNVGQGMQDHVFAGPSFRMNEQLGGTFTDLAANPLYLTAQLANFSAAQLGPLTSNIADFLAWERIPPATANSIGASVLNTYPSDWPHIEYFSGNGFVGNFDSLLLENAARGATGDRFSTILVGLVAPRSRGTVTITSGETADLPTINPNWLTDPVDQQAAIFGFKRARDFFAANAMQPVLAGDKKEYYPGADVQTDDQILKWYKDNLQTIWHPSCTAKMATKDKGGVLDSHMKVYGVDGLRVVDASSFPVLPPGHPQSTIYMLAERAATLIKSGQ